jgi:hypothetical protein
MEKLPLARFQRLIDLLGPGIWVTVDRVGFKGLFGHDLDGPTAPAGLKLAKDFAKDCGCSFIFDADRYEVRFLRAYSKREDQ